MAEANAARFDEALCIPQSVLLDSMRCWRAARESGAARKPCLYQTLAPYRLEILAPVFDSLMTIFETSLKPCISSGEDGHPSADENALLGMLIDPASAKSHIARPEEDLALLECALLSTRLMMEHASAGVSRGRQKQQKIHATRANSASLRDQTVMR